MELFFIISIIAAIIWYVTRSNKPSAPDLSILPERFVVFDLETTGLNPDRNKIIEIGAIRVNRDSSNHETMQTLISIKGKVPEKITQLTGITNDMLAAKGDPLESALEEFIQFIGDLRLVSFNAPFDTGFMNVALESCGKPRLKNKVSCALDMARRAWPGRKSYKLKDLSSDGNLGNQDHRALNDCQLAMMVYVSAASKLRSAA